MPIPNFSYSFANGFEKLTLEEAREVKNKLYELLQCTTESDYSRKKNNFRNMPLHVYKAVTKVFNEYKVPEEDIWSINPL